MDSGLKPEFMTVSRKQEADDVIDPPLEEPEKQEAVPNSSQSKEEPPTQEKEEVKETLDESGIAEPVDEKVELKESGPAANERGEETLPPPPGSEGKLEMNEDKVPEWQATDIPEHWRPLPLFLVRNIPLSNEIGDADIKSLVEAVPGLRVHSVSFDDRPVERLAGRRTALVRLKPMPLPWKLEETADLKAEAIDKESNDGSDSKKQQPSAPPQDGDVLRMASWAVQCLKALTPTPRLGGEELAFEVGSLQVQLYIGNLAQEWQEDAAFIEAMSKYGTLERAFVMRNAAGLSKGYGFVEFSLPGSALACKQAMDEIEQSMRPDPRKPRPSKSEGDLPKPPEALDNGSSRGRKDPASSQALRMAGWPESSGRLVKLLRAEWAIMRNVEVLFSRVLYVTNLRTGAGSHHLLKDIFRHYGKIAEVTVPINKATNSTKGFAFVAFVNGLAADRAFRALQRSGSQEIGGALVSFANSAKAQDMQSHRGHGKQSGGGARPQQTASGAHKGGSGSRGGGPPKISPQVAAQAGRGAVGRALAGRGMMGRGPIDNEDALMRQSRLHMQAGMAANMQMARQLEMRLQQQMQAQQVHMQAQMQAQLRQAQLQVQQFQQQAQQLQRQAAQAHAKAAQEAEARKRLEEESTRRAAQARLESMAKSLGPQPYSSSYSGAPETGRGSSAYAGAAFGGAAGSGGKYSGSSSSGYGGQSGYGQPTGSAGYSAGGYGNSQAGGSYSGMGHGAYADAYGSQAFGAHDYDGAGASYNGSEFGGAGSEYGQPSGYDGHDHYGGGSFGHQSGYGSYGGSDSRSGGPDGSLAGYGSAADYGSAGYGQGGGEGYGGAEGGYDQQGGYPGYGQQSGGYKRSNPYHEAAYQGYGGGSGYEGEYGKRPRF